MSFIWVVRLGDNLLENAWNGPITSFVEQEDASQKAGKKSCEKEKRQRLSYKFVELLYTSVLLFCCYDFCKDRRIYGILKIVVAYG